MRNIRFYISFLCTAILIYLLNNSWQIGANRIPPLGKFLDPFHGFWQNIESKQLNVPTELKITGLKDKVLVAYDSLMIPHIFASNDEDLYLAQGYVTAKHRLWQMEFQTHAAAGRISEILGEGPEGRILNYDRSQRRLGLGYGAGHALEAMLKDPTMKMVVEKYTEGINQYVASLGYASLPFEYKLLDYEPEDWTTLKCALLLKSMAQTLNMSDKDIEMTNALKLFGKETVDLLYPDREPNTDPIVYNPGGWKFDPVKLDTAALALPDELITIKKLPGSDPTTGSNNWAVAGSKTATGSPILCGDPHLNLSLPSIWYAIQLNAPGVNSMGVSLPGAPGIIIGFNDSIAWSVTNAQRDLVDWLKITYKDSERSKYKLDEKWVDTKKVIEEFNVRGKEVFRDTVIYTNWGPVTYDKSFHAEDELKDYAFRWMSHDGAEELMTFYKLNRAKNHQDYMNALDHYGTPAQNFVFASVSGDIAMRVQGKYPVRRKDEGKFVLDGSKSSSGWQAYIPNDQNVMYKNPSRGFVSSANQYPADSTYPYYVTASSFEAYRNRRINQVLSGLSGATYEDMANLQGDNYNLKAAESLPMFLAMLDTTKFDADGEESSNSRMARDTTKSDRTRGVDTVSTALRSDEKDAYAILKSWDYFNNTDSEAASYYEAWWDNLLPLIWDEMSVEKASLSLPTTYNTIKLIKEKPNLSFFDMVSTPEKETAKEVVQKAFSTGVKDIKEWRSDHRKPVGEANSLDTNLNTLDSTPPAFWADYKGSFIGHLLRLQQLSIPVRHGGNHDIVNAHSRTHGPSWRMIVSLEKTGVKAWAVYPGGQSGNPGSYYYDNMIPRWTEDKHYQLEFMKAPDQKINSLQITVLNPDAK